MTQDDLATDDVMILDTWEQVKNKLTPFAVLYAFRAESVPTKRINSTINLYLFGFFFILRCLSGLEMRPKRRRRLKLWHLVSKYEEKEQCHVE